MGRLRPPLFPLEICLARPGYASDDRLCSRCLQHKPFTDEYFRFCSEIRRGEIYEFYKKICRRCEHERRAEHRRMHRGRENAARRRNSTYVKYRSSNLKKNYGLSIADYEAMLKAQNFQCAVCGREDNENHRSGRKIPLVVDHDHETGKVRGLLCGSCNRGLGDFRESVTAMVRAIRYLKVHKHG